MTIRSSLAALGAAAFLAACGGGGSSSDGGGGDDFDPVNAQAAHAAFSALDGTWDVSGVGSDGATYRFIIEYVPAADGAFPYNGVNAKRRVSQSSGYVNGDFVSSSESMDYFNPSNAQLIGSESEGMCMVTIGSQRPPTSARVGDTGGLFNYEAHSDCTNGSSVVGSGRYTWSIEAIDGKPYYCVNTSATEQDVTAEANECYEVATSGALGPDAALLVSVRVPGQQPFTLTAKTR